MPSSSSPLQQRIALILALGTMSLLSSCSSPDRPVQYKTVTFEETLEGCPEEKSPCARVSLSYPEITRAVTDSVRSSLNEEIRRPLLQSIDIEGSRESPKALAEELFFYYSRTVKEFPNYAAQWFIERTAEIVHDSLGILTVEFNDRMYSGGAHTLHQQFFRILDTRTGVRLEVDSLVHKGGAERLWGLAERVFRRVREIPPGRGLNEAGFWFQANRFTLNENIGLTSRGLEVIFNPYEIAPYAMGGTRLVLPYDSLQGVLDLSRRSP